MLKNDFACHHHGNSKLYFVSFPFYLCIFLLSKLCSFNGDNLNDRFNKFDKKKLFLIVKAIDEDPCNHKVYETTPSLHPIENSSAICHR